MPENEFSIQIGKSLFAGFLTQVYIYLIIAVVGSLALMVKFSLLASAMVAAWVGLLFFLLIAFGLVREWLFLRAIRYSRDKENFVLKGGIISRFERIIPYSRIQHVIVSESFTQRLVGLGSVIVQTARETESNQRYNRQQVYIGSIVPGLLREDAKALRNELIYEANKHKPVAGI